MLALFTTVQSEVAIFQLNSTIYIRTEAPLRIFYWPQVGLHATGGRAAAMLLMCEYASTRDAAQRCEHVYSANHIKAISHADGGYSGEEGWGKGTRDVSAPPIVEDSGFWISQSAAATMHVGEKLGFGLPATTLKTSVKVFQAQQYGEAVQCSRAVRPPLRP